MKRDFQNDVYDYCKGCAHRRKMDTGINCEIYFERIHSRDCFTSAAEKRAIENEIAAYHAKYDSLKAVKADD